MSSATIRPSLPRGWPSAEPARQERGRPPVGDRRRPPVPVLAVHPGEGVVDARIDMRLDLGVRHPDWPYGYILGVECDGAPYHSSRSSRDRDRLRQEVLEGLGWRLHRIWSTDWFRNPRKEIEVLKEALDAALVHSKAKGTKHSESLDAMALLTHLSLDTAAEIEASAAASVPSPSLLKPEQASLPFNSPADGDRFTTANRVPAAPTVLLGSKVKVENITDGKKLAFTLVAGENAPEAGKVGLHTPLGQALLDAQVGDEVEYQVGSHIKEVRVLDIR